MSSAKQNLKAGQSHGQSQAMADEWMQSTKDTASAAMDKTADAIQSARNSAPQNKEQAAGFLQQMMDAQMAMDLILHHMLPIETGEQVKCMAQGAVDTVKSTLGVVTRNETKSPIDGSDLGRNAFVQD